MDQEAPDGVAAPPRPSTPMASDGRDQARKSLASCNSCRKRKVKCDRGDPCSSCQRSAQVCVTTVPPRLPRGRQGGRRKANHELLQRIAKLENLVKDLETETDEPTPVSIPEPSDQVGAPPRETEASSAPRTSPAKSTPSGMHRYLSSPFWFSLSDEIKSLHEVLDPSDDEDEETDEPPDGLRDSSRPPYTHSSGLLFGGPPPWGRDQADLQQPAPSHIDALFTIYFHNVDRVFKLLHRPTVLAVLQGRTADMDYNVHSHGFTALTFAIYYCATTSLTNEECQRQFGAPRSVLVAQYRAATELALARADLVNTTELATLQALLIFLVAARCNDNTRFSWTLLSLAVRIAQALGLHRETSFASLPPFYKEMRRRLWWQLMQYDGSAADDRGTDPIISHSSFNTQKPRHVNDDDLHPADTEEARNRDEFCDMTFCCLCHDVCETGQWLNHVPAGEREAAGSELAAYWRQRRDRVIENQRRIEDKYLRHCDLTVPMHWATRIVADVITAAMWLMAYRPLQRHPSHASSAPVQSGHPNILQLSVEVLEHAHQINTDPATAFMRWLSNTYVQWHAMAVTLAELCVQTDGPLVARAWTVVDASSQRVEERIADSSTGMLWRPIKKLMKKARSAHTMASRGAVGNYIDGLVPFDADATTLHEQATLLSLDHPLQPSTTTAPAFQLGQGTTQLTDWDKWLNTNPTHGPQEDIDMNQMAWSNWEGFVDDFHGETGNIPAPMLDQVPVSMPTQEYVVPSGSFNLWFDM